MLRRRLQMAGSGGGVPEWRKHLQPCEWLETDGNCYLNTNTKILDIDYIDIDAYLSTNGNILGGGQSGSCIIRLANTENTDNKYFALCWQNANYNRVSKIEYGNWVKVIFDKQNKNIQFNDEIISITGSYSTVGTDNLYLFCLHYNNVSPYYFYAPNGSKIKQITTNLFNLIAAYVIDEYTDNKGTLCSSGVAGMVDIETGVFYTNDSSGVFSHGGDIEL